MTEITILGASGRIGSQLTKDLLINNDNDNSKLNIKIVGRELNNLKELIELGAKPIIARDSDDNYIEELSKSFNDSKIIFLILVPNYIPNSPDFKGFQYQQVDKIISALKQSNGSFEHLILLSSWGADKETHTGPVEGLHYFENQLNLNFKNQCKSIIHLRVSYFIENLIPTINKIKNIDNNNNNNNNNIISTPFNPTIKLPLITTNDIGNYISNIIKKLINNNNNDKDQDPIQIIELQGSESLNFIEITQIISNHYNKSGVIYQQQSLSDFENELLQNGFSNNVIELMKQVCESINNGHISNLLPRSIENTTPTTLKSFLNDFDKKQQQ